MQEVKVRTVGDGSRIEWLLIVDDKADSKVYLQELADEYALDLDELSIEKQMRLFDGDLPVNVGEVYELVRNESAS